jgi:hypothetical protein
MMGRPARRVYQGVSTEHSTRNMHEGRFAAAFDRYFPLDPHHAGDVRRLRSYTACMFAEHCRSARGDYLFAGISYGVLPRVIFEFIGAATDSQPGGRVFHLIDPFTGVDETGSAYREYNTDAAVVTAQYPPGSPIRFWREFIPGCFPLPGVHALAFVHLDTGVFDAEAASLSYLYGLLSPGGVIIIDHYAFGTGNFEIFDPEIDRIGATVFAMVTGQGIIMKPWVPAGA